MKRLFTSLFTFVAILSATAATIQVGACDGKMAEEGAGRAGTCEVGAACKFPASLLEPYRGMEITAVRMALITTDGVQNLRGWVRPTLEGQAMAEQAAAAINVGWNTLKLDKTTTVPQKGDLWVGYSFNQTKQVKCISVVGKSGDDTFWFGRDEKWSIPSNIPGILSVEIEVSDPSLPECDLNINSFKITPIAIRTDEKATLNFRLQNVALKEIKSFDYKVTFGDRVIEQKTVNQSLKAKEYYDGTVELDGSTLPVGKNYDVTLTIATEGDENADNNVATRPITIYSESYDKKVLIEEFTGESCPNCPRAIRLINEAYEGKYAGKIAVVAHHTGYADDFLTSSESKTYLWFFPGKSTFAPAAMFDRTHQPSSGYESPINEVFGEDVFNASIDRQLAVPTFVGIDCLGGYDENKENYWVNVWLGRSIAFDVMSPGRKPRISVFITEDNVDMQHQAGDIWAGFVHNHVYRQRLTPAWGQEINWDGNQAYFSFKKPLNPDWEVKDMQAVVFVHDYNSTDRNDCMVYNVNTTGFGENVGVEQVIADAEAPVQYFDLQGRPVADPQHGIFICRQGSKTSKVIK